jgi:hypothetical protein
MDDRSFNGDYIKVSYFKHSATIASCVLIPLTASRSATATALIFMTQWGMLTLLSVAAVSAAAQPVLKQLDCECG